MFVKEYIHSRLMTVMIFSLASFFLACSTLGVGGLRVGGSERGMVAPGSNKEHKLNISEAADIVIDVMKEPGSNFDPMVELYDSSKKLLGRDDDGGTGLNARLRRFLQKGAYSIVVRGYGSSSGPYRLHINKKGGSPGPGQYGSISAKSKGSINVGQTKSGFLNSHERHQYNLKLNERKMIIIDGVKNPGSTLDAYLILKNSKGQQIKRDDDGGEGLNSRITTLLNKGEYQLIIKGYSNSNGQYNLSVRGVPIQPLVFGQSQRGTLEGKGQYYYSLNIAQGGLVDITNKRTDQSALDPFLTVQTDAGRKLVIDDDSGGDLNSKITFYLAPGNYLVTAEASDQIGGNYEIMAGKSDVNPQPHKTISIGKSRNGWIIPEARHSYTMNVPKSTLVIIENMRKDDSIFNPYLTVETTDGRLIGRDDNSGSNRNARLITLLRKGSYKVIASGFGSTTGQYKLSVRTASSKFIGVGKKVSGTLTNTGLHIYRCSIKKDGMYTVDAMRTKNSRVDTYLTIITDKGLVFAKDDDSGAQRNAKITSFFNKGNYYIVASSYGNTSGQYDLSVKKMVTLRINVGQKKTGTIAPGGRDFYKFNMKKSGLVIINCVKANNTNFDTYLELKSKNGAILARDDDGGEGLNARLSKYLTAGSYNIVVRGFGSSSGDYELTVARDDSIQSVERTIAVGQEMSGNLQHPEQRDRYTINVASRMTIIFRVKRTKGSLLDTFVEIYDTNGNLIASDDDGGRGLNSTTMRTLEPGRYVVVVRAYRNSTGRYLLSVRQVQQQLQNQQQNQQQQIQQQQNQ